MIKQCFYIYLLILIFFDFLTSYHLKMSNFFIINFIFPLNIFYFFVLKLEQLCSDYFSNYVEEKIQNVSALTKLLLIKYALDYQQLIN